MVENKGKVLHSIDFKHEIIIDPTDILGFTCGNTEFDEEIRKAILKLDTVTYKVLDTSNENIVGIYSLSCTGLVVNSAKSYEIYSAVEIKYFAVSTEYQDTKVIESQGCVGSELLYYVLAYISQFTEMYCGARYIILYSVPSARNFYVNCGFKNFATLMCRNNARYLQGCYPMFVDIYNR